MSIIRDGFQSADLDVPVVPPTLNLDFANSQELDPRITFSRGSIGTFVNKNGLIETASANTPRFDYNPISGECRGLLIEESRQNLLLYSEDFSNAYWGKNNSTLTSNEVAAPNGTLTADKWVANVSADSRLATQQVRPDATYAFSFYVKSAGLTQFRTNILGRNPTAGSPEARILWNLSAISATLETGSASISIQSVGNGWFRCIVIYTKSGTSTDLEVRPLGTLTGNGTSGIYIWGAQLETGAFPTSYIPTTTSSVTRSADNADMTGSNFTSWANSSVGTFVIRGRGGQSSTQTLRGRFVGLGVGAGAISLDGASTVVGIWDNTNILRVTNNSADVVNRNSNIAASFDGTLRRIVLNGVASSGISRRNINTIFTQISLGKNGSNNNYLNGTLSRVAYYPRQLNDAQMLYLTQ